MVYLRTGRNDIYLPNKSGLMSDYYTKEETDIKFATKTDLSKCCDGVKGELAEKADKDEIPTKISDLTNDSGYITQDSISDEYYDKSDIDTKLESKADKSDIPTKTSQLTNDSGYVTSTALDSYAKKTDIPTKTSQLTNDSDFATNAGIAADYYDKEEVDAKIAGGGTFDPTNYYTKGDTNKLLDAKADKTALEAVSSSLEEDYYTKEQTDGKLGDYALKSELPTKTSQLTNDSDFATNAGIADNYYNKQEVDNKITQSGTFDPTQYYTKSDTDNLLDAKADKTTLAQYALKTDIPTKVSAFENDKGYLTQESMSDEYYTKAQTDTKLNNYALKSDIPSVPTKTSELTNDSGFVNGGGITTIWQGTASEYEAITSKSNTTLYLVTE